MAENCRVVTETLNKPEFLVSSSQRQRQLISCVESMMQYLDPEPTRDGLQGTPERVARAYVNDLLWGYEADAHEVLNVEFDCSADQMVMVANIPVYSLCEHHMLPFVGRAWVAYIPANGKVTGISKLARLTEIYARRLQIQERLTQQIADTIMVQLEPLGVGVFIECEHLCMTMRGAQVPGTLTSTSCLRGLMWDDEKARAEFYAQVNHRRRD